MDAVWLGSLGLMLLTLIRRHGWEYVPVLLFLGVGRWYASGLSLGLAADGLTLFAFAGVWVVSKKTGE